MPKKRIWTDDDINNIINWYTKDGYTINYIAKNLLHCRESSLSKILKENNITIRNASAGRKLNINEEKEVVKLYIINRYTLAQIAEKYNCAVETIHKILLRNNIEIIKQPTLNINQDDYYFDNIDNEHKAYWLGFIFADGNVYNNQLSIEIHIKDKELLEEFKKDLKLNSKISIRKRKNTEVCCIHMTSTHLCATLANYGIVPNKTYNTKHLPEIPLKFIKDFLRGLIDGDGWISISDSKYYHIGFVSNYQSVCEDFKHYCNILTNNKCLAKITHKGNNSGFCFLIQSIKQTKQLATVLYKDNTICLSRKYRLVEPLFDLKNDEDIV